MPDKFAVSMGILNQGSISAKKLNFFKGGLVFASLQLSPHLFIRNPVFSSEKISQDHTDSLENTDKI